MYTVLLSADFVRRLGGGYSLTHSRRKRGKTFGKQLQTGDQIILYTDGITEARNTEGVLFGTDRLDHELENCSLHAKGLRDSVLRAVDEFTGGHPADDDRTIIVARIL